MLTAVCTQPAQIPPYPLIKSSPLLQTDEDIAQYLSQMNAELGEGPRGYVVPASPAEVLAEFGRSVSTWSEARVTSPQEELPHDSETPARSLDDFAVHQAVGGVKPPSRHFPLRALRRRFGSAV